MLFRIKDSSDGKYVLNITYPFNAGDVFKNPNVGGNANASLVYEFPIYDQGIFTPGHNYTLEANTVFNGTPFKGKAWNDKRISTLTTIPKIDSGYSIYSSFINFSIGPLSFPIQPSGEVHEIYLFNPTFKNLNLNLSIKNINWNSINEQFKKQPYVCISNSSILNFSSCEIIYRYDSVNSNKYPSKIYANMIPLEKRKLYMHVYCNDSGNPSGSRCSDNLVVNYGKINLNVNYRDTAEVNNLLSFDIYHRDSIAQNINSAHWRKGNVNVQTADVNDTVNIFGQTSNIPNGKNISVQIYNDSGSPIGARFNLTLSGVGSNGAGNLIKTGKPSSLTGLSNVNLIGNDYYFTLSYDADGDGINDFNLNSERIKFTNTVNDGSGCELILSELICKSSSIKNIFEVSITNPPGLFPICSINNITQSCIWNSTRDIKCYSGQIYENINGDEIGKCEFSYTSVSSECSSDGFRDISATGVFKSSIAECNYDCGICPGGVCRIKCGKAVSLPFFGLKQSAATFIGIIAIYFLIMAFKKRKR